MAEIKGFRGWRYNPEKVKKLAGVVAPPYDVISKKEQDVFYRKHPANVIRLILGKDKTKDSFKNNRYTRAREFLQSWIVSGILVEDRSPSVYVYVQDYREEGRKKTRVGFIAAMRLDNKSVLRHDKRLAGPKKDRLALLKEVRTNLSPIFGLFEDKDASTRNLLKETLKTKPALDVAIDGVRHRIFVEGRDGLLGKLCREMKPKPVFIADGHHRFEVACEFKRWMQLRFPKDRNAPWNYVMMYFSDCVHNPFKIYPTHRLLKFPKGMKNPVRVLSGKGKLVPVKNINAVLSRLAKNRAELSRTRYDFGIYTKKNGFFFFTLDKKLSDKIGKNPARRLDVAVLHDVIVAPCFGLKKIEKSEAIDFTRDAGGAVQRVRNGEFDIAIFLRPTSLKEMIEVSKKGLKMPQKSTYFYPKLLSGLVFHHLNDGVPAL